MEKMADQNDSKKAHSAEEDVSPSAQEESTSSPEQTALGTNDLAKDVVDLKVQVARVEEKSALIPQILNKIDDLAKDISDLKVQGARVEEKIASIPKIDKKVQTIQRIVWTALGVLLILGYLIRSYDITIVPK